MMYPDVPRQRVEHMRDLYREEASYNHGARPVVHPLHFAELCDAMSKLMAGSGASDVARTGATERPELDATVPPSAPRIERLFYVTPTGRLDRAGGNDDPGLTPGDAAAGWRRVRLVELREGERIWSYSKTAEERLASIIADAREALKQGDSADCWHFAKRVAGEP